MPDYIFDTTVLSNLAAAGRLELLEQRYRELAVTTVDNATVRRLIVSTI